MRSSSVVATLICTVLCLPAHAQNGAPALATNPACPSASLLAAQREADLKRAQDEAKKAVQALQQALDAARKAEQAAEEAAARRAERPHPLPNLVQPGSTDVDRKRAEVEAIQRAHAAAAAKAAALEAAAAAEMKDYALLDNIARDLSAKRAIDAWGVFLKVYPQGFYANLVRCRIESLRAGSPP